LDRHRRICGHRHQRHKGKEARARPLDGRRASASIAHLLRALETFKAQGIEFVSFSEQMDTSTPAGKMVFTVLGAVAELERSLIVERVKAGLRNAKAKGKPLGRPKVRVDSLRIVTLRRAGRSWSEIASQTGRTKGTVQSAFYAQKHVPCLPKIL
jgi:DNA invertase Pin-like site-specific DNA recombinase